jgi:hypothetical protein
VLFPEQDFWITLHIEEKLHGLFRQALLAHLSSVRLHGMN